MDKKEALRLYEYLESLFNDKLEQVWTAQPCTIISYSENTINCTLDKEGIELHDVPISLFGNPDSYIQTPTLEAGTTGLLIFSKHDLYIWIEEGKDPTAKTDFSKNNAFFLIGATNHLKQITYNPNAVEIKTNKAVEITARTHTNILSPKISLNNGTNELFALLVETLNECSALANELSLSKDKTYNLPLTNSTALGAYTSKFSTLSQKYGGFIE